jgi:hypothetical protein
MNKINIFLLAFSGFLASAEAETQTLDVVREPVAYARTPATRQDFVNVLPPVKPIPNSQKNAVITARQNQRNEAGLILYRAHLDPLYINEFSKSAEAAGYKLANVDKIDAAREGLHNTL